MTALGRVRLRLSVPARPVRDSGPLEPRVVAPPGAPAQRQGRSGVGDAWHVIVPSVVRGQPGVLSIDPAVVTAQLRLLLTEHEVRLRSSRVRVRVEATNAQGSAVELLLFDDLQEGGEAGVVTVPSSIVGLTPVQQWWLAFQIMRRACEEFAAMAAESSLAWGQIADSLLARGPVERVTSAWKASPDRRHRGRVVAELRADCTCEEWDGGSRPE